MSSKLSRRGYQQLIDENIDWLLKQPRTLERDHTIEVLKASVDHEYPPPKVEPKIVASIDGWDNDWIEINWAWEGKGFGQIVIKKTARGVITDAEYMSNDSVRQILGAIEKSLRYKEDE